MRSLSTQLTNRLADWNNNPFPIHKFVRVNFSHDSTNPDWKMWSDYPYDITVDGFSYTRDNGLIAAGAPQISDRIDNQAFSFTVFDDDAFIETKAIAGNYRGLFLRCDIHFASAPAHVKSLLYRDILYEGVLDSLSVIRSESGNFIATLSGSSPFASLDTMRGRSGSKEDQKAVNSNDTSMDEALKSANDSDLKWGQPV